VSTKIGIYVFDGAEELDFVGPYEVFTMSNELSEHLNDSDGDGDGEPNFDVFLVSELGGTVQCAKGMRIETDYAITDCPDMDVILVPGGKGTRQEVRKARVLNWIAEVDKTTTWTTSVCTGALLLTAAGPAKGKRVTTHWGFIDSLRERDEAGVVLEDVRYVRDGKIVTAAGVSAGIDMALWLLGQMHGEDHARMVQRLMEYDPLPPYQNED